MPPVFTCLFILLFCLFFLLFFVCLGGEYFFQKNKKHWSRPNCLPALFLWLCFYLGYTSCYGVHCLNITFTICWLSPKCKLSNCKPIILSFYWRAYIGVFTRKMSYMFQIGVSWSEFSMRPIHFHGAVMAMFASLIAPFGGFFASGFKRAFKLKVSCRSFVW